MTPSMPAHMPTVAAPAPRRRAYGPPGSVADRRRAIDLLVRDQGAVTVSHLARVFGVSKVTIRGDLQALVAAGTVRRFHGGALRPVDPTAIPGSAFGSPSS